MLQGMIVLVDLWTGMLSVKNGIMLVSEYICMVFVACPTILVRCFWLVISFQIQKQQKADFATFLGLITLIIILLDLNLIISFYQNQN